MEGVKKLENFELGLKLNSYIDNYAYSEFYVNILSSTILLLASFLTIMLAHFKIKVKTEYGAGGDTISIRTDKTLLFSIRSPILKGFTISLETEPGLLGWRSITGGILFAGLIGLGEVMEHFASSFFSAYFFHYLHIIAAPASLYFFHRGIRKHARKIREPIIMPKVILAMLVTFLISGALSILSMSSFGPFVERYFLSFIIFPMLVFYVIMFRMIWELYDDIPLFVPLVYAMVAFTTLSSFFMLLARLAFILDYFEIYVVLNTLKDLSLAVTAAGIIMYAVGVRVMKRQLRSMVH
jgi:hypothetical protein